MIIICFLSCVTFLSMVLAWLTAFGCVRKSKQFWIAIVTFLVSGALLIGFCIVRPILAARSEEGIHEETEKQEVSPAVSIGDDYAVVMIPNEDGTNYTAKKLPLHNVTFVFDGDRYLLYTTKYSISSFWRLVWDVGKEDTYRLVMPESENPLVKADK